MQTMDEQRDDGGLRWLLFIYRVPQEPPGRRTYVWRQLKGLGAAYLQQAAAILPDRPALREALTALQTRIAKYDGEASLLETTSPNATWEQETMARFNEARDAEYAELYENAERLEDEIARESRRGKFIFAELEELEADWEKLVRWRERIRARDFFAAPGHVETDAVMARARTALDLFTIWVYDQPDTPAEQTLPIASQSIEEPTQHTPEVSP
jgi:hypothetical protein